MDNIEKKKRGRRKKLPVEDTITEPEIVQPDIQVLTIEKIEENIDDTDTQCPGKKRGRKPKGGKLIFKKQDDVVTQTQIANVILHLKCSLSELDEYNNQMNKLVTNPLSYNPDIPLNILTYNSTNTNTFSLYNEEIDHSHDKNDQGNMAYEEIKLQSNTCVSENSINNICSVCKNNIEDSSEERNSSDEVSNKDINLKLKQLKINLYKNNVSEKKSACFWCTYEYDNPSCYVPKYEMDENICGYGSFCRPECAVAFLMKENIDDSTKFERYHLLNQIYGKVYEHRKNIKPAPDPHFLLEKFYGNLTIQEYRKLLKTEHMLLVVEKPMTRILPELFEDNEDFTMNIYGGNKGLQSNHNSIYKVKRQSEQQCGPSKSSIMRDKFGI